MRFRKLILYLIIISKIVQFIKKCTIYIKLTKNKKEINKKCRI